MQVYPCLFPHILFIPHASHSSCYRILLSSPSYMHIHWESGNYSSLLIIIISSCTTFRTACFSFTPDCLVALASNVYISPFIAVASLPYLISEFQQHRYSVLYPSFFTHMEPIISCIYNPEHLAVTLRPPWFDQGEPLLASSSVSADANDLLTLGKPIIHSSSFSSSSSRFVSTWRLVLDTRPDLMGVSVTKVFPLSKSKGDEDFWLEALLPTLSVLVTVVLGGTGRGGFPVNCLIGFTGVSSTKT